MKFFKFFLILVVALVLIAAVWYGLRYLFDPQGLSLEKGAICTTNESEDELVFSVESIPGSKMIAFLAKGESLCAPSSVSQPKGVIRAGEDEDRLKCVAEVANPDEIIFLSRYFGEGKCDWGMTTR